MFDPSDPNVRYTQVLTISNSTELFNQAFKNGSVVFELNSSYITLNCTGVVNLTVSYNGSECGFRACPYPDQNTTKPSNRPIDRLINVINTWFKDVGDFFSNLFKKATPT